ncbi:MAG: TlpA disulfide reductase family protein [Methylophilaceae bacterium]|jgi:peroxiredoxin|nr:TlpA disulfide reductase family protein [Methylophilaceae bacterium]
MIRKIVPIIVGLTLIGIVSLSLIKNNINDINMITIKGKNISTYELRGKVYLINFWATDCPGCINEMPGLINTYNNYKNQNFEVIAVAMFYDPPSRVLSFAKTEDLPFPVVLDVEKKIMDNFKDIKLTPTSILIDHKGKIINTIIGEINFPEFNQDLEILLKKANAHS